MKAKPGVIDQLNGILTNELTAINQYFLQASVCKNWGYERLYEAFRERSMSEMRDAEELIEYILILEGLPNLQRLGRLHVGESVQEGLEAGKELEENALATLAAAVRHCAQAEDHATRQMLERMAYDEQEDLAWFETQLETIRQIGLQNYLSQQINK